MCAAKTPKASPIAAAPAAPLPTASVLTMGERPVSRDGSYGPTTARSRSTLRTDLRLPSGLAGINIARMG